MTSLVFGASTILPPGCTPILKTWGSSHSFLLTYRLTAWHLRCEKILLIRWVPFTCCPFHGGLHAFIQRSGNIELQRGWQSPREKYCQGRATRCPCGHWAGPAAVSQRLASQTSTGPTVTSRQHVLLLLVACLLPWNGAWGCFVF